MRLAALLLMVLHGTASAQALPVPRTVLGGATLNTSNIINLNSQTISGGSLTLGSGGGLPAAPTIATNPAVNQAAGSITLRAGSGLSTLQAPTPRPLTVSGAMTAAPSASFLSAEATRLTLTAMPASLQSLPQLREGVFVQPGTALTGTLGARQAVLIEGRIRFTQ